MFAKSVFQRERVCCKMSVTVAYENQLTIELQANSPGHCLGFKDAVQ